MLRLARRHPYKIQRSASYWPGASASERRERTADNLRMLLRGLGREIDVPEFEPDPRACRTFTDLKRVEDRVDALLCAWAGLRILDGTFVPYGDGEAAIWNPGLKNLDGLCDSD